MTRCVAALAVAVATVGAFVISPAPAVAAPAAGAATCAFAPTSIAVVVDFGDGSAVSAVCVPVNSTDNGASVLAARASVLGTPAPRFNSSGLLCGIDGTPTSGCGEQVGSQYAYWSYWHGTGGAWSYSNVGPGGSRVRSNIVEGWRFQPNGAGNPSDPPPRGSADPTTTCAPAPATSSSSTAATTSTAVTGSASTSTSNAVGTPPAIGSSDSDSESTTSTTTTSSSRGATASGDAAGIRVTERSKGSGAPWGLVGGGGLIAGLGAAGALVARRRRTLGP